jgi:hypothetical protein
MALASAPLTQILALANGGENCPDIPRKINDQAYLDNAIRLLKIAKALDQLNNFTLSYKYCAKAFKIIDTLVKERKEQPEASKWYMLLLAPFYFKLGDSIATFIECNTDEFGNVKALDVSDSSEDEAEPSESDEQEVDPREESKDEPKITTDEV